MSGSAAAMMRGVADGKKDSSSARVHVVQRQIALTALAGYYRHDVSFLEKDRIEVLETLQAGGFSIGSVHVGKSYCVVEVSW